MSVEKNIFDTLKALVSSRVFFDSAPFDTPKPYIILQQVGGQPVNYLNNQPAAKKNGRFQVEIWATSRVEAANLQRQVEDELIANPLTRAQVLNGPIALYEEDLKLYGTQQDFSIWF